MGFFKVEFAFESSATSITFKSGDSHELVTHINENRDGFFGDGKQYVNLRNVNDFTVIEVDKYGNELESNEEADLIESYTFSYNAGFND